MVAFKKTILIYFLIISSISFSQINILDKNISLSEKNKNVKTLLKIISDSIDVHFSYNPSLFSDTRLISIACRNENLESVLLKIINDSLICFKVVNNHVVLNEKSIIADTFKYTIKGRVITGELKSPVPFATIKLTNKPIGTICDEEGIFLLNHDSISALDSIVISAVGYKNFVCPAELFQQNNEIEVLLEDSIYELSESIVFGYEHFQAMYWTQKSTGKFNYLLTCVTNNKITGINFVDQLTEILGKPVIQNNYYKWKNADIENFDSRKSSITLSYFTCDYCPLDNDYTLTIEINDKDQKNLLFHDGKRNFLTKYFQEILNNSKSVGVSLSQLNNVAGLTCLQGSDIPYTGRCFSSYARKKMHIEGGYVSGLQDGTWSYWFSNGQLGKKVNYYQGNIEGKSVYYYDNGQKKLEVNYLNGEKHGDIKYWYKNGILRLETSMNKGQREGIYRFYYPNGRLGKEASYKNGAIISASEWDKKGKLINRF